MWYILGYLAGMSAVGEILRRASGYYKVYEGMNLPKKGM